MAVHDFETILEGKYPAKHHIRRVVQLMREKGQHIFGIIYVEGSRTRFLEDSDLHAQFRQRRSFYYLTGCDIGDCSFIYDIQTNESTLLIPDPDPDEVIWSGEALSPSKATRTYDVDGVCYTSATKPILEEFCLKYSDSTIYTLPLPTFVDMSTISSRFRQDKTSILKDAIDSSRIIKDDYEIAMIKKANQISSSAHMKVMQSIMRMSKESEIEAMFVSHCISQGSRTLAYPPIAASGAAPATLHYEANDAKFDDKLNVLHDAGTEWRCYASDITRTFPISGAFSVQSRNIYELVLNMQETCLSLIRAGINWDDNHIHAHKIAIDGLLKLGILVGDPNEIFRAQTTLAFFPHGLGHYIGLDVHDVGGNATTHDENKMLHQLRKRGPLPAGSVITVEPGIYFCKSIIIPYLQDPKQKQFIDERVLDLYWDVGGVRIEDNVLVTEDGYENLTTVIKRVDEIEDYLQKCN